VHTILKKIKLKERGVKLLLVGTVNAGKTTSVKKFNGSLRKTFTVF
jgi:GTPase SAR1 family protein